MKIRNGFVSNSSSSSFIIRGMKLSKDEIIEKLNVSDEAKNMSEYDFQYFIEKKFNFSVEPDGNYFGGKDYNNFIIGKSIGYLEDGEVVELPDRTEDEDKSIIEIFENLGFSGKLSTFVQMISNDNY